MVGQASSLSMKNDGQDARRHQILFLFAIIFENRYSLGYYRSFPRTRESQNVLREARQQRDSRFRGNDEN